MPQRATFEVARSQFEWAWRSFLPMRTEADFREWRNQRDWTAWKYERIDLGTLRFHVRGAGGRELQREVRSGTACWVGALELGTR